MGESNVLYIEGNFDSCDVKSDGSSTPTSRDFTSLFLGNISHPYEWRALGKGVDASIRAMCRSLASGPEEICLGGSIVLPGSDTKSVPVACYQPSKDEWRAVETMEAFFGIYSLTATQYGFLAGTLYDHDASGQVVEWLAGGSATVISPALKQIPKVLRVGSVYNGTVTRVYAGGIATPQGMYTSYSSGIWQPLDVFGDVYAIECGTDLCPDGAYVGGQFKSAGGVSLPSFGYYDNRVFHAVGGWTSSA